MNDRICLEDVEGLNGGEKARRSLLLESEMAAGVEAFVGSKWSFGDDGGVELIRDGST